MEKERSLEPVLVSACLLGAACRYDGGAKPCEAVLRMAGRRPMIPVCPEQLGGLPTPRPPAERIGARVLAGTGADVTEQYARGAAEALRLANMFHCKLAILKERSPSCGHGTVYDGSFSGKLCSGDGVAAALLRQNGVRVIGESEAAALAAEDGDA